MNATDCTARRRPTTLAQGLLVAIGVLIVVSAFAAVPARATTFCSTSVPNPVACENSLPGDPPSDWQVSGAGDPSIQGFGTSMSVNVGGTISFKIDTPSTAYHIDILRLGYYGGDGARMIAAGLKPSATLPQSQPACLTDSTTGLIDCGNWGVSASWTVPTQAVSGVYIAHLVRDDGSSAGLDSQIPFVVRNDSSHSAMLVQTSDATWEAYNDYGGASLYTCTVAGEICPSGNPQGYKAAYAVSYNRPFDGSLTIDQGRSYLYYAEYQMIRFLEENGYDASYTSESDVDASGSLLMNHKLFITSGHDEYWSAGQRANVQAARDAGVNLAFFSGNEMFWKTRWGPSIDGSGTSHRTLISYKETHFNAPTDPQDPPTWTGTWLDPRFSPPADGGQPTNALTGQQFDVNSGTTDIQVPYQYSKLRMWRNTAAANLTAGHSLTLSPGTGTLGYEWDLDEDNGFRPPGEFDLSSTTANGLQTFTDYGSTTTDNQTATHHLTLYRAPSGALVFGAGTVQWSWGLDNTNPSGNPPDPTMQQATVNLFADMGAQPATLISGLTAASPSRDTTPPTSTITSPSANANLTDGSAVTVTGTATDAGGGVVAGVEVSTDGGSTWHPATLTTPDGTTANWSYSWTAHGNPTTTIMSRATDDSGNREAPSAGVSVNVNCPCAIWGNNVTPQTIDSGDGSSVEVGVKFRSDVYGAVTGVRFYKASANTGTHVGSLWTASGTLLAQATFSGETASGWQQVTFSSPVYINPNTTYIAGYFAPNGHYSGDTSYFYTPAPAGGHAIDSPPLHALQATASTQNGMYSYGSTPTVPTSSYFGANYYVDVSFAPAAAPGQATGVSAAAGPGSATVSWSAPTTGGPPTQYTITPYIGSTPQPATTVSGSPPVTTATVSGLTPGTSYTFTVTASNPTGTGPASADSNAVTPTTLNAPSAPESVTASPATAQAVVTWALPASNGGSTITGYTVTPYVGSTAGTPVQVGSSATSATLTGLTNGTSYTFQVTATNSVGTGAAGTSPAVTPADTIFDFAAPTVIDSGDTSAVELGVKFTSDGPGSIIGIRFYKSAANTGTHVVGLWSALGALLAQANSSNETASGWQQVYFSSPVSINANTTYVAGYFAPNGHYSVTPSAFASSGVDKPPLHALANGTSPNGVYAYGSSSGFPSSSFNSSNYSVDVMLTPTVASAPSAPQGVSATAATKQALVSWSSPASSGGSTITGYTVTPYAGSTAGTPVQVSGGSASSATVTGLANGTSYTFQVTATNSTGTSAAGTSPAVTPADTIFDFSAPTVIDSGDTSPVELGVKFTSDVFGTVTGIRFYKAAANTGTHVVGLWTTSGTLLAQANSSNETASGWQQVYFSSPVSVTANTAYVAGYFAPNGHYSVTSGAFASAGVDNPPLHALANGTSPNGVYAYGSSSTFPSSSYNSSNYSVDVMLASASAPGQATNVTATAGTGSATVSWSAPTSGGPVTGYTVTPYIGSTAQTPTSVSGSATTATVSGLTPGTAYTFTVTGSNPTGSGPASTASNSVTPTGGTAPGAPQNVSAQAGTTDASVSWSAPASNGGSPVTGYTVTPYTGASAGTPVQAGASATSATVTGLANGTSYTFQVTATSANGTSQAAASNAVTPQSTIFDFRLPTVIDSGDSSALEVGVKFTSDTNGLVTGLRFYKAAANTGTHIGTLWASDGTLLGQVTFANETASGWQEADFPHPIAISANTTYVGAYFAPNGHYSVTSPGFSSAVDSPPLHAVANATSANGVYSYSSSSTFPTSSFNASNYWVDVMVGSLAAPGPANNVSATAGNASATLSWSAPSSGGPVTQYTITPYTGSTAQAPTSVSGSTASTTVSGLTSGTAYTFTVTASNPSGSGPASAASNSVTPTGGTPSAPQGVGAIPATSEALVSWSAPASNGGSPITGYTVTPYVGSTAGTPAQVGASATSATITGLTNGTAYTFAVTANNSVGAGAAATSNVVTPKDTIFDFGVPSVIDSGDTSPVELGVKFTADINGSVTGVRFYKAPGNTGTHVGSLWTSGGTLLAQVTFTNETPSGWQEADFSSPVPITAGNTYVVSYLAPNGHYSATPSQFASGPVDNAPLHAVANSTSQNGVYAYASSTTFPTNSYNATGYSVDVMFG
jgi:hypothetical protein